MVAEAVQRQKAQAAVSLSGWHSHPQLSSNDSEELLQPSEKFLFDIARGLLADPEVLVVQDMPFAQGKEA